MADAIHIPPFQYGKHSVEAWGHRSAISDGVIEMIWSIRVDDAWLGSLSTPPDVTGLEIVKRIKYWVIQNLPKPTE
jgi:hypothetical protein